MVKEQNFVSIDVVLDRILRSSLLQTVSKEQAIQYAIDFIHIVGAPKMFIDKITKIEINNYRALLPCDIVSINQIRYNDVYLVSMNSAFNDDVDLSYKTQGNMIFTSFEKGTIEISYKAVPSDNGFPLIPDNPLFLKALELYIKKEVFTNLFEEGRLNDRILQHTEQQYCWTVGQLTSEYTIPSISEMENIKRMWNTLYQDDNHFNTGFRTIVQENFKSH